MVADELAALGVLPLETPVGFLGADPGLLDETPDPLSVGRDDEHAERSLGSEHVGGASAEDHRATALTEGGQGAQELAQIGALCDRAPPERVRHVTLDGAAHVLV